MSKTVTELTYDNLDDFFNAIVDFKGKLNNEFIGCSCNEIYNKYIFRGEGSIKNKLIPSALRIDKENELCQLSGCVSPERRIKTALQQIECEEMLLKKFYSKCDYNGLKIPSISRLRYHNQPYNCSSDHEWLPEDYFELAGLAQHYGLPTRLLDWSLNFHIALYFALKNSKEEEDEYCSVWAFNYSAIGHYFVNKQNKIMIIIPEYSHNPNLMAQKGVFTHWQIARFNFKLKTDPVDRRSLDELFESQIAQNETSDFSRLFYKINIPIKFKKVLYKYISTIGFDGSTLFPGYDGITRSIKEDSMILKEFDTNK